MKSQRTAPSIVEEEENHEDIFGDDMILDDEGDQPDFGSVAGYFEQENVSGIKAKESFSLSQLHRMSTIRRIFEQYNVDISKSTFRDVFNLLADSRDLGEESVK